VVDLVAQVEKQVIKEQVNEALKNAAEGPMKGILEYSELELVSSDYRGHDASSIVDASLTMVMGGDLLKVVAWYDNEWGYSQRVVDLAELVAQRWVA
jgi:glyceraldehyde-3-phosphate dehydrogenase (NAD(P))